MAQTDRWLRHDIAHLHRDFIPDPETPLLFVKKLPGGNSQVRLPDGMKHILKSAHLSNLRPADQRRAEASQ